MLSSGICSRSVSKIPIPIGFVCWYTVLNTFLGPRPNLITGVVALVAYMDLLILQGVSHEIKL